MGPWFTLLPLAASLFPLVAPAAIAHEKRQSGSVVIGAGAPGWPSDENPFLTFENGVFFRMQDDGNFVIGQVGSSTVYWATNYAGHNCDNAQCQLQFLDDGNLITVDDTQSPPDPYWDTGTIGANGMQPGHTLSFRDSAPWMEIYDASGTLLWQTYGKAGMIKMNSKVYQGDPVAPTPPYSEPACYVDNACYVCMDDCPDGSSAPDDGLGGDESDFDEDGGDGDGDDGGSGCEKRRRSVMSWVRRAMGMEVAEPEKRCQTGSDD